MSVGKGLYVNDWTTGTLRWWKPVNLPVGVEEVYHGIYVAERHAVVIADNIGVHHARWPSSPDEPWEWTQVPVLQRGRYSGLAVGPDDTVTAAYWGVILPSAFYGIVVLHFVGDDLEILSRATIVGDQIETRMTMVSLTSCASDRERMYAAAAGAGDDASYLLAALRSDDGGRTWRQCGTSLRTTLPYPPNLLDATGHQGTYNNCIEVSPVNSDVVILGWCTSGPFLSIDGGNTWQLKHADQDSSHLHSDLHAIHFDTSDASGRTFYVCSDGGVAKTSDLGDSYDTRLNAQLPDFQFERPWGHFHASPVAPGVVSGGLQDQGVLWGQVMGDDPWNQIVADDGYRSVFLGTGQLVFTSNTYPAPQICDWKDQRMSSHRPVPVVDAKPGLPGNAQGLYDVTPSGPNHEYRNTILAPVPVPSFHNARGQLMYALGSVYSDVYGLFASADGSDSHWGYIGSVDVGGVAHEVRCLSAFHGDNVYVGTADGRIFALDPQQRSVLELNVTTRVSDTIPISRIATYDSYEDGFAIHGTNVLRLDGFRWNKVAGLPEETFYSLAIDSSVGGSAVFAATDSRVYSSRDGGVTWLVASNGLPERVHCSDLAIGPSFGGNSVMYVSTYGRSVWWAPLR